MDFNDTNSTFVDKSTFKDGSPLLSCRSNPSLLSFNNYIKLGNCEHKEIEKLVTNLRESLQKSEANSLTKSN